ncbi:Dephospho-CoA kinase [Pseudoalteromonas holothuriae]|uniref:Dephospho-CoA kinase n=1 Tax=Pseudoalteromonas holothuriae TaxID=2963714 RepID=A0ABN8ULX9_9GAMM|nr:dephospho-CoA kinase [Pseudoalteromonas sp. CIP111951]CAH9053045.1 Dephospho-CoA kinase [Pseudoalteromonas sp. CIP111951]
MSNWILGLTGGIGAGKTAVSDMLAKKGITIVDADVIAKQVVALGSVGLNTIVDKFGKEILQTDGTLDRAKLRHIIFSDSHSKQWLEQLLHPLIREEIITQLHSAKGPYVVLSAPLLFENKLDVLCSHTLLVDVPEHTQLARTTERDSVPQQQVEKIIAAQMSRAEKLKRANTILNNDKSLTEMYNQLEILHQNFVSTALNHSTCG